MREKIILYKTDDSFDYADFPNSTVPQFDFHGVYLDIKGKKADLKSLEGFGNLTYLTTHYDKDILANEIKTHYEDALIYQDVLGAVEFYENNLNILLNILKG